MITVDVTKYFNEVLDSLEDMVNQHCYIPEQKILDSMALSANRDAMLILAKHGRIKILRQCGRRVIAEYSKQEPKKGE